MKALVQGDNAAANKTINFKDCMDDYFKKHHLDTENQLTCEACDKHHHQFEI
jgi:ubiquitin C-terminal hydrolase